MSSYLFVELESADDSTSSSAAIRASVDRDSPSRRPPTCPDISLQSSVGYGRPGWCAKTFALQTLGISCSPSERSGTALLSSISTPLIFRFKVAADNTSSVVLDPIDSPNLQELYLTATQIRSLIRRATMRETKPAVLRRAAIKKKTATPITSWKETLESAALALESDCESKDSQALGSTD